jgi:hypothetical protein
VDALALNGVLRLHKLTMVEERDGVMVGRPDIGSYALFPQEGAETLRQLDAGATVGEIAAWYERACGLSLDVEDYLQTLDGLQFVMDGEDAPAVVPVRFQRLAQWVFSPAAWLAYAAIVFAAAVMMVREPWLRPSYRHVFFTSRISVIPVTLMICTMLCIVVHESFHALAGRRLGLPSTFGVGRRLIYLVAETRLDALLSVPRKKRYLPFLAGMLTDVVVMSALTLLGAVLRGSALPAWCSGLCLAVAFTCVLRLLWQFLFYVETDLYFVATTALRCADLQNATRFLVRSRFRHLMRRPPLVEPADWSDHDRAVARWYAPLLVAGYGFSLGTFVWAGLPTMVRIWSAALNRLTAPHASTADTVDALVFLACEGIPMGFLAYLTLRDWRQSSARRRSLEGATT